MHRLIDWLIRWIKLRNFDQFLRFSTGSQIKDYEPYCRGVKALLSPHTGIVDYGLVTRSMGENVVKKGGEVKLNFEVTKFQSAPEDGRLLISAKDGRKIFCKGAIVCGGLQSDRLAVLSNCKPTPKIVPFRGDYLRLKPEKRHLVRGNIYPVPDPRFPFLGVHFTPRMNGDLWLGPTAVLSFAREGYGVFSFNLRDTWEAVTFPGLIKLGARFLRFGLGEMWRNIYTPGQVKLLQRYIPDITPADVERAHAGNRAQAIDINGDMVDDFIIDTAEDEMGKKIVHVRNAPSPAATSSLAIAHYIIDTVKDKFQFLKWSTSRQCFANTLRIFLARDDWSLHVMIRSFALFLRRRTDISRRFPRKFLRFSHASSHRRFFSKIFLTSCHIVSWSHFFRSTRSTRR